MKIRRLQVLRVFWIILFLLVGTIWITGTFSLVQNPVSDCTAQPCDPTDLNQGDLEVAAAAGYPDFFLSGAFTAGYNLINGLIYFLTALVIFVRKSDEWIGLLVSATLVILGGIVFTSTDDALLRLYPQFDFLINALVTFGVVQILALFFVFPDGRFVPRKLRIPGILGLGLFLVIRAIPGEMIWADTAAANFTLIFYPVCFFAQIYRYQRVSSITERQQTKWVVLGLLGALVLMMTWSFLSINHPPDQPGVERLSALTGSVPIIIISGLLLPLSFAFSILRYRLWDIDILIRRTISYAILTGLLLAVYFGLVIGTQNILGQTTGEQSQALVVVSTLVIAALFNPLRVRVQNFIDRRFYRAKYDAEQTLARFAQTARDEVDMDILSAALLGVVDETMQPDHFAIWLKGDEK